MFYNFKKIPISINGKKFVIDNAQLSTEVKLEPVYTVGETTTTNELPSTMWTSNLKFSYYLTGQDYLKQYIYSNEYEPISGNLAGLQFNQGYLSNYSLSVTPNNPIYVSANIAFFDQITGTFSPVSQTTSTGFILRSSDIQINNLSNYTVNTLTNFISATLEYSCDVQSNFNYYDTGIFPANPDNVFFGQRTLNTEITSDNLTFNLPVSGERFGIIITTSNPNNTGLYETFGCSGKISSKSLDINTDKYNTHVLKVTQSHINNQGYIYSVLPTGNLLTINFNTGYFPLLSNDQSLNNLQSIFLGDTPVTGYTINRTTNYDQIVAPIPFNVINDILTVYTNTKNYIYPNKINFTYPSINISGISANTGQVGTNITISGTNFIRVSDVLFGGIESQFQISNPQTILATIPNNGISFPITVLSYLRNQSGTSSSFYYQPLITNITPITGQWKDTITISGINLTGTTGVYFGNVPALSFSVINNNLITAKSPDTGQGFASGFITVYSTGGIAQSVSEYNPVIPIYSFSPSSGQTNDTINIYTKIDTGYLYPMPTQIISGYLPYSKPTGLYSWYKFQGDASDVLNINNGISFNNPSYTVDMSGFTNYAISLNGINQYVTPSFDTFNYINSCTISIWWQRNGTTVPNTPYNGTLFSRGRNGYGNGRSIQLGEYFATVITSNNNTIQLSGNPYPTEIPNPSHPSSGWHNTALVWNTGHGLYLYQDGILTASGLTTDKSFRTSTVGIAIGKDYNDGLFFGGALDDVRIYQYPLSSGEVNNIYTSGAHLNLPFYTNYISGGYKVKVGGQDTRFYLSGGNSTGTLTGTLLSNISTDYIYIYEPDGISTSSSSSQYTALGSPIIYYTTPLTVNQYSATDYLIVGQSLNYFYNLPYYVSFSGGISGDFQSYGLNSFTYSPKNGGAILLTGIIFTGSTGLYNIKVQNSASSYTLTGGLTVNSYINQASIAAASTDPSAIFNTPQKNFQSNFANFPTYLSPSFAIDNSPSTFYPILDVLPSNGGSGNLILTATKAPNYFNISTLSINQNYTGFNSFLTDVLLGQYIVPPTIPTGSISLYRGSNSVFNTGGLVLSGLLLQLPNAPWTGITKIVISAIQLPIPAPISICAIAMSDVQIY